MDIVDKLKNKNIKTSEISAWGFYLRKQWVNEFAGHLTYKEKKSIYLYDDGKSCGYLWHLFSYEKKDSLKEKDAENAFDEELKKFCYIFYQHSDNALIVENASKMKAIDLIDEEDIYVVDKGFNWTFVITHEKGWFGPYFSKKSSYQ